MILSRMHIESFRGMNGVSLKDLAPVSLLMGANNTGKSSVLEAASLLLRPLDSSQWIQTARLRDMDMSLPDALWSLFPSGTPLVLDDGPKQTAPLKIAGNVASDERFLSAVCLANMGWDRADEPAIRIESKVNDLPSHTMEFRRDVPARFGEGVPFHRCFTVTPATHRSTRNLVEHLSKAIDAGEKKLAVELLRLFDPKVESLDVSSSVGREGVRVTHAIRGVVDLASFGDGMRRCAALALALVRSRSGLLLVDELEAAIHPGILPEILKHLFSAAELADVQILATTHSLEAVDAVIESSRSAPDRVASFYLQREENSHIVRRYAMERLIELRESGVDLR